MPVTPIKTSANADLSASSSAGKSAHAHAQANASAAPPQNQNPEAFRQVNQQLSRNNSQGNQNNQAAAHGRAEGNQAQGGGNSSAHASLEGGAQVSARGNNGNHSGAHHQRGSADAPRGDGNNGNQGNHSVHHGNHAPPQANRNEAGDGGRQQGGGNGNAHAHGHAEGHVRNNGGGNNKGGNPLNINIDFSANAQTSGNNQIGGNNQASARAHINNHSAQAHAGHSTRAHINSSAPPDTRQSTNSDLNLSLNLNGNGNHNGVVRSVLNQVLRENDIYLNQNAIRHFVNQNFNKPGNGHGNAYGNRHNVSIPPEITQIVRTIRTQLTSVLNNPPVNFNGNVRVTIQNSAELASLIQASRSVLLQNFGAKPFVNLNLQARMYLAAELILKHLPKLQPGVLPNYSAKQILNGLLLARGFAITADKFFPRHDIFSAKKFPLPYNVPPVVIRNLGNAVKSLIVEARLAQTAKDLEVAAQKFLRSLSGGKNNPDALLSAVKLAAQFGVEGNAEAGEAALPEKIAGLVKFLILAGDKAVQSVADAFDAAEAEMLAARNAGNSESAELERNREMLRSGDKFAQAEGALRRQLEFNPFLQNERAASAFDNPGEASRAREEFANRFRHEIEQWLQSGNHRFVRDIELEKPVGIVVERGTSGFFTADRARIVLVRDGSVQGWHFLKSFLVK